jgi:D-alanine-D-alanine ligase
MSEKLNVWIICGGRSAEHEVSLESARSIASALDRRKYELRFVTITKRGKWVGSGLLEDRAAPALERVWAGEMSAEGELAAADGLGALAAKVSPFPSRDGPRAGNGRMVAFPVLHGPYGEDGTIQGLFEMLDIPYVGSGVLGSALAMDKAKSKEILFHKGIPVARWISFKPDGSHNCDGRIREFVATVIRYPCFVKPANLGSSVGITKVKHADELNDAIRLARCYDTKILIEEAIDAREIECSVLGNGHATASVPGEVVPEREFYDYQAKYCEQGTELIVPAELSEEQVKCIQSFAVRAFYALECCGMARVDFFLDKRTGRIIINELNTIPGFTQVSMYPKLWEASGLPYPELLDRLIELALERHRERKELSIDWDWEVG